MSKSKVPQFNQKLNTYLVERGKQLTMLDAVQRLKKEDPFDEYDAHVIQKKPRSKTTPAVNF